MSSRMLSILYNVYRLIHRSSMSSWPLHKSDFPRLPYSG